ncbi:hypothetical protein HF263_36280 [Rhizobium leguminosarum]|uniref:hypothetical protein n=1 Tax=Rhizobium leguminosarum TaxID=384 RepID=UPI001C9143E2|nr:hypothetical protein [Rhizobium leguminosarum]MBY2996714.1 hypothetical protein [Rhizobium leguminosarum]MBY3061426.1 hypothetical protein [Rhizobium leguminosarum]
MVMWLALAKAGIVPTRQSIIAQQKQAFPREITEWRLPLQLKTTSRPLIVAAIFERSDGILIAECAKFLTA